MPQVFMVVRCFTCDVFQVQQVKKVLKWSCKMCGAKQSLKKEYGRSSGADCRRHVQKLNMLKASADNTAPVDDHHHEDIAEFARPSVVDDYPDGEDHLQEKRDSPQSSTAASIWHQFIEDTEESDPASLHPTEDVDMESIVIVTDRDVVRGRRHGRGRGRKGGCNRTNGRQYGGRKRKHQEEDISLGGEGYDQSQHHVPHQNAGKNRLASSRNTTTHRQTYNSRNLKDSYQTNTPSGSNSSTMSSSEWTRSKTFMDQTDTASGSNSSTMPSSEWTGSKTVKDQVSSKCASIKWDQYLDEEDNEDIPLPGNVTNETGTESHDVQNIAVTKTVSSKSINNSSKWDQYLDDDSVGADDEMCEENWDDDGTSFVSHQQQEFVEECDQGNLARSDTTGIEFSGIRTSAGRSDTTGIESGIQTSAGRSDTTGNDQSSGIRTSAGRSDTTGIESGIQTSAGRSDTTGNESSGIQTSAGRSDTTGNDQSSGIRTSAHNYGNMSQSSKISEFGVPSGRRGLSTAQVMNNNVEYPPSVDNRNGFLSDKPSTGDNIVAVHLPLKTSSSKHLFAIEDHHLDEILSDDW